MTIEPAPDAVPRAHAERADWQRHAERYQPVTAFFQVDNHLQDLVRLVEALPAEQVVEGLAHWQGEHSAGELTGEELLGRFFAAVEELDAWLAALVAEARRVGWIAPASRS